MRRGRCLDVLGSGSAPGWDPDGLAGCVSCRGDLAGQGAAGSPPGWPSGEGVGLKIQWAHARVGSNPTSGRNLLFLAVHTSPSWLLEHLSRTGRGALSHVLCLGGQNHSVGALWWD